MTLSDIIIEKIRAEGPISFHDFMEMSLYYPHIGYYTSPQDKIGKNGDYLTSPHLTSLYGEMIGKQVEEMWSLLGKKDFRVVEYGAGTGILCYDMLNHLKQNEHLYENLHYCIIEKSPAMREKESATIGRFQKVNWYDSISDIPSITGCILSNEVVDNFSVHRVIMQEELMEIFVDYNDGFKEVLKPAPDELKDYLRELDITLPKGFHTEINLEALEWIKDIAINLKEGFVITIDYGYSSLELYNRPRNSGTLKCYYKHRMSDSLYNNIGEQDITTHVNFSALAHWGLKNGLKCCGFTDQSNFLRALGVADHFRNMNGGANETEKISLWHTLLMDMGRKFKVLIQQKGLTGHALAGLQFAHHGI